MLTAEGYIKTDKSSRYMAQLCKHASGMGEHLRHGPRMHADGQAVPTVEHVEWSDTNGIVRLNVGQWTMLATADGLTIRAAANDEASLGRIQNFVSGRIAKIGRRDALTVRWLPPEGSGDQPSDAAGAAAAPAGQAAAGGGHRKIMIYSVTGLAALVLLVGALRAAQQLPAWVAPVIVAVVIVKIAAIVARRRMHLRRRAARASGQS